MTTHKQKLIEVSKMFLMIGLIGIKSFVYALSQIVWLFAAVFILIAGFFYLNQNGLMDRSVQDIKGLWLIIDFFRQYWEYFFLAIWLFDGLLNLKEVQRK